MTEERLAWIVALDAFDHDAPDELARLIEGQPVPVELRPVIAAIIRGERKPSRRRAAKLKLPASERMQIAASIMAVLDLIDSFKTGTQYDDQDGWHERKSLDIAADRRGVEPITVLRDLEARARAAYERAAASLGVSTETVENIVRELREKLNSWPDV